MLLMEVKAKAPKSFWDFGSLGKGKNWPIIAKFLAPFGRCCLVICSCSAKYPVLGKQQENRQSYHSRNTWISSWCALPLHRPRILEMDKEENRRSVLLPKHRRRSSFSSENYWRRSYEYTEDCDEEEEDGSPARKVKMRRH